MHRFPHQCPICGQQLTVTEVSCKACETHIQGKFKGCRFCALSPEESGFLLTFIKCRGSIKDVERELGVSYPTVRAMLDNLITALDREEDAPAEHREAEVTPPISVIETRAAACTAKPVKPRKKANATDTRRVILERLAAHEITAEEAAALLKNL